MPKLFITVITASTGNPLGVNCINSVYNQTYPKIQHLIVVDGNEHLDNVKELVSKSQFQPSPGRRLDIIPLPYSTGKSGFLCHRIYGGSPYFAEGEYISYLDDDNTYREDHLEKCLNTLDNPKREWVYSFRNIQDQDGNFICQDNCESLGIWSSFLNTQDHLVDTNCYLMRKHVALSVSPNWHRQTRKLGIQEADRAIFNALHKNFPNYSPTYEYSVNYTAGNNSSSVKKEFFIDGNKVMMQRYEGKLPWIK